MNNNFQNYLILIFFYTFVKVRECINCFWPFWCKLACLSRSYDVYTQVFASACVLVLVFVFGIVLLFHLGPVMSPQQYDQFLERSHVCSTILQCSEDSVSDSMTRLLIEMSRTAKKAPQSLRRVGGKFEKRWIELILSLIDRNPESWCRWLLQRWQNGPISLQVDGAYCTLRGCVTLTS